MSISPVVLPQCVSIAGSDSGGGAGIQADLKTFAANGVYGTTVITAITAQNTQQVRSTFDLPSELIRAQLEAIFEDFEISAAKTGMLGSGETIRTIVRFWKSLDRRPPLVVDPVLRSTGGQAMLAPEAVKILRQKLLPLATLITPNREEAEILSGIEIRDPASLHAAGRRIIELGAPAVLLKGGHLTGGDFGENDAVDLLLDERGAQEFTTGRISTTSTHGTGCTLSAAICAALARGSSLAAAVDQAKTYVTEAIRFGWKIGHGPGPVDHFYFLRGDGASTASRDERYGA